MCCGGEKFAGGWSRGVDDEKTFAKRGGVGVGGVERVDWPLRELTPETGDEETEEHVSSLRETPFLGDLRITINLVCFKPDDGASPAGVEKWRMLVGVARDITVLEEGFAADGPLGVAGPPASGVLLCVSCCLPLPEPLGGAILVISIQLVQNCLVCPRIAQILCRSMPLSVAPIAGSADVVELRGNARRG